MNTDYCHFAILRTSFFFAVITTFDRASSQNVFNADDFRTETALPAFEKKFFTYATEALQNDSVADLFTRNIHRGSGRRGQGRSQGQAGLSHDDLKQMLNRLKVKVDRKYSNTVGALMRVKDEFERYVQHPSLGPSSRLQQPCCYTGPGVPPGLAPRLRYEGRYRDQVNVTRECVAKTQAAASTPFTMKDEDTVRLMKGNFQNDTGILWQYLATVDGHYVQFPTKDRYCDRDHTTSPLTQRWMVDKLLQSKPLNLMIIVDASVKMNSVVSGKIPPVTHLVMAKDAVRRVVKELAFNDRVSVVVANGSTVTPPGCGDRLMAATPRNVDIITSFLLPLAPSFFPNPDLGQAFQTAYSLLRGEKAAKNGKDTNDVIILLTNGEFVVTDEKKILAEVKAGQNDLDNKVTHLVYLIQSGSVTPALDTMVKLADLNNQRNNANAWQGESGPVGPVGLLKKLQALVGFGYGDEVAKFYRFFPGLTAAGDMDRVSAYSPRRDPNVGLIITYVVPVYSGTKDPSSLYGAAAIDVSLTSLFDDVIHFQWKLESYSLIVERNRGLVLVHPKLENPAKQTETDPVFTALEFLEPTFTPEQRRRILMANVSVSSFDADVIPGRTTYRTGQELLDSEKSPATVLYCRLPDTDYVLGIVIFRSEMTSPSAPVENDITLGFKGDALYHHQLLVQNKPLEGVCADSGDVRVSDKVTVKFSPEIFTDPEVYIHSKEPTEEIANMTEFLNHEAAPPLTIRQEVLTSVIGDLRIISSMALSRLWRDTSAGGIVERCIGTPHGVFAAYPGISLPNAFDGKQYGWYRESLARPGNLWVSLRLSLTTGERRVSLSTTVGDLPNIFGVTGITVPKRSFAGLLYNTVEPCLGSDYTCHLLTDDGYFLDVLHAAPPTQRHVTSVYPWLANVLIRRHVMKPIWCTSLSKGRHSLTYILHVAQTNGVTHEAPVQDKCRQFLLYPVRGSNLLVLVVFDRMTGKCSENNIPPESCSSCQRQPGGTKCARCVASSLPSSPMSSVCQCPCYCDVDLNVCQDSYRHMTDATSPLTPCYEEPEMPNLTAPGGTNRPLPILPPCDHLCPSFEKQADCEKVSQCEWKTELRYPVCDVITTTTSSPTSSTSSTLLKSSTSLTSGPGSTYKFGHTTVAGDHQRDGDNRSGLGSGAVAGIVVVVLAALAALLLIGYYKLIRPRVFIRLLETESAADVQGACNSAQYHSKTDSLDLNVPAVSPSGISAAAPVSTGMTSSRP